MKHDVTLPAHVAKYSETPVFTESTVPEKLTKLHDTKPGVWGKLVVVSGALDYIVHGSPDRVQRVEAGEFAVIEPTVPHKVSISVPVSFQVEFYKATEPSFEAASPPCEADRAEDGYMGFATRQELLDVFTELLKAERAGAQTTALLAQKSDSLETKAFLERVHQDECHCCRLMISAIERLDGEVTDEIGDFTRKVMSQEGIRKKLALLNRGQLWVVKRVQDILPKVRDDVLHSVLKDMLDRHIVNTQAGEDLLRC